MVFLHWSQSEAAQLPITHKGQRQLAATANQQNRIVLMVVSVQDMQDTTQLLVSLKESTDHGQRLQRILKDTSPTYEKFFNIASDTCLKHG